MNQENGDEVTGRAKGGIARRNALTADERHQIAKRGASARWGEKPIQATHKGNFQEDFGINVECYVLNDELKTAVISQRGMGAALKLGEGGRSLPRFVDGKIMSDALGVELLEKISKPLIFMSPPAVGNSPPASQVYGYDVTILIDITVEGVKTNVPVKESWILEAGQWWFVYQG